MGFHLYNKAFSLSPPLPHSSFMPHQHLVLLSSSISETTAASTDDISFRGSYLRLGYINTYLTSISPGVFTGRSTTKFCETGILQ